MEVDAYTTHYIEGIASGAGTERLLLIPVTAVHGSAEHEHKRKRGWRIVDRPALAMLYAKEVEDMCIESWFAA